MKKLAALLPIASYLSLATPSFADNTISACVNGQFQTLCQLQAGNFGGVVGSVINLVFVVSVVFALFYLIYGGFRWLISTGDKGKVTEAREHIIAAIIGLVIIFLAYFILNLILGFFNIGSLSNLTIPNVVLNSPGK
jgi:type IV secretory pathway VirB2 component (pilin)